MATAKSIKSGTALSVDEMKMIIKELAAATTGFTALNGQPLYVEMKAESFERLFNGRKGL